MFLLKFASKRRQSYFKIYKAKHNFANLILGFMFGAEFLYFPDSSLKFEFWRTVWKCVWVLDYVCVWYHHQYIHRVKYHHVFFYLLLKSQKNLLIHRKIPMSLEKMCGTAVCGFFAISRLVPLPTNTDESKPGQCSRLELTVRPLVIPRMVGGIKLTITL